MMITDNTDRNNIDVFFTEIMMNKGGSRKNNQNGIFITCS
jgi:hypothetical protein